jgi:prepilin-type N-terminal cleavage/methylation domain-containing protein
MSWRERLRDERGYTLIELIMATSAGLIVAAAALTIIILATQLSQGDSERVDADQQGGAAMERIFQALNSSCVEGYGVSPIVGVTGTSATLGSTGAPPSSNDSITFFSSLTDSPTITPSEIVIYLSANNGPLMMSVYTYNTSTNTYPATPSSTYTLLSYAAAPGSTPSQGSTAPVFSYYGYNTSSSTLSSTPFAASPSLGATNAADTAEVTVSLQAQPTDGTNPANGSVDLSNAVVLRLSPISNNVATGATGTSPCS